MVPRLIPHRYIDPAEDTPFSEPVKLPSGAVYEPDVPVGDGHERGFGWEYIKRTPGIHDYSDVGEVLDEPVDTPNAVDHYGEYDIVIGENPNGPGQIELWLLNGLLISASHTAYDQVRENHITIEDRVINKIINKKDDWDHNQLGKSKEEVLGNLIEIIESPDEIWKDSGQDRWMYTKKLELNGRELIVVLFVMNGKVESAFVPTHNEYIGETGYSREFAEYYIKKQEMVKEYEEGNGIATEVNEGERAQAPKEKPNPTQD